MKKLSNQKLQYAQIFTLNPGHCFYYNGSVYMVADTGDYVNHTLTVNLSTNHFEFIHEAAEVDYLPDSLLDFMAIIQAAEIVCYPTSIKELNVINKRFSTL